MIFFFLTCSDKATFLQLSEKPKQQHSPRVTSSPACTSPLGECSLRGVWESSCRCSALVSSKQGPGPREVELKAQESQRKASETGRSKGVREKWRFRERWGPLVKEAQPHLGRGALCDGTIGIPLPGESLIEKYERSHMEKMASMIAVQLLPHSQRGILVANTSLISGGR